MERTTSLVVRTRFLNLHIPGDDINDIEAGLNLFDSIAHGLKPDTSEPRIQTCLPVGRRGIKWIPQSRQ